MTTLFYLIALALSIVRANGWFIVPGYCVVFAWIIALLGATIASYVKGVGEGVAEAVKKKEDQP